MSTPAHDNLFTAWAAANAEITNPNKDSKGNYGRYLGLDNLLDTLRPIYAKHGLVWWQTVKAADGIIAITTHVAHVSGERLSFGTMSAPLPGTVQQVGSARTYLSRYSYLTAMGIAGGEDDDGQAATDKAKAKPQQAQPQSEPVKVQRRKPEPDQAPLDAQPAKAGAIEPWQHKSIGAIMGELGIKAREDALAYCAKVIGRSIESRNDLTKGEADAIIKALTADRDVAGAE